MRPTGVLLNVAVAALLNGSYESAARSSKSTKSVTSSTDQSCEQTQVDSATGEYSQSSAKSSSQSAVTSSDSSSESYVAYKSGAPPCGDSLPARKSGECDEVYYKRIFPVDECDESCVKSFYLKVFKQYQGECDQDYVKRIDAVFVVYQRLDCRTNVRYIPYLEKYVAIKYAKEEGESDEAYLKRTITKTTETEVYTSKVTILRRCVSTVDWSRVTVVYSSAAGYTLETSSSGRSVDADSSSTCSTTLTEEEVKKIYARKDEETDDVYFKRIVTKTSSSITKEEYIQTITIIRKTHTNLDLWYNKKYLSLVKEYYTSLYTKRTIESEEQYFERIITKESYETAEQCARRVEVVRELCPNLSLWSEEKYYEKYTKEVYSVVYRRADCEDKTAYYERIVRKTEQETDTVYIGRVTLIQKTLSGLCLWYSEKTFTIVKKFYNNKYAKKSGECDDDYIKRLTVKETWETTDEVYVQRICLVYKVTIASTVWSEEKYYEQYTKKVYLEVYKKANCEDETAYFKRIVQKTAQETDSVYVCRVTLIQRTYNCISLWYSEKTFDIVKQFYTIKYTKKSGECDDDYIKRIIVKESWESTDEIYVQRIHLIHQVTTCYTVWYEEKYYEKYTKTYYSVYYKKGANEGCDTWLIRVVTLLPGESEENAIKRITLVNKSKTGCNCWTTNNFTKVECVKSFSKKYLLNVKKTFIKSGLLEKSTSAVKSACQGIITIVKRGNNG